VTDENLGDYVLVHRTKAKISRARKMVIGMMAVGAVAALTGAGTFASFSASTTNDASFKTGRLILSDKINTDAACFSTGTNKDAAINTDANTDENDTDCEAFFANNLKPGDTATVQLTLKNESTSDYTGALSVFADSVCTNELNNPGIGGSNSLCDGVHMAIQQYDATFTTPGTCFFPASAVCDLDEANDRISNFTTSHNDFATERLALGANLAAGDSRYLVISMKLGSAGGFSSTGIGLDNVYMNKKANLKLRFHLADA
jgi:predicted ribosomally synthesized peptide with SipW-like signal peptide